MNVDVVLLPRDLPAQDLPARTVVVFDVLRATTTMTAALEAGVKEILVFPDVATVTRVAQSWPEAPLLCGEERCLPPPGFDLGNSPGAFRPELHAGRSVLMSTTNGTRAMLAARGAGLILAAALTNASAAAAVAAGRGADVTLLCAGTGGQVAMEDLVGAGAVLAALVRQAGAGAEAASDVARIALRLFHAAREDLPGTLRSTLGGRNVIAAGLSEDIDFAARLDATGVVGFAGSGGDPPVVRRWR